MKRTTHPRLLLFVAATAVFVMLFACCETSQAARNHRRYRTVANPTTVRQTVAPKQLVESDTPENVKRKLAELCEELKADFKPLTPNDLAGVRKQLVRETDALIRLMKRDSNRASAAAWTERFALDELQKALQVENPDDEVLGATWRALHGDFPGIRWNVFDPLRVSLRRYFRFQSLLNDIDGKQRYELELVRTCTNLPGTIEAYSQNKVERQDTELANTIDWLEDVSCVEPRAARIARLARTAFSGVNVNVRIGSDFVGAGFRTEIVDEPVSINENILGTRMVGNGIFSAVSEAGFVENPHRAEISVNITGTMNSVTTGYNSPVTLRSTGTAAITGEKRIVFTEDRIYTTPSRSRAQLSVSIDQVRINGGPMIQCIARKQIQKRQGASKAESQRRTEMRVNQRLNERIDERIEELNRRYQEKLREPLVRAGLFPRVWNLAGTAEAIHWSTQVGDHSQPSAMNTAPGTDRNYDLLVQVHQSAPNNAAAIALTGRYFDEDQFVQKMKEQFEKLGDRLDRPENEEPLRLTFGPEAPIRVGFDEDKMTVLIQVHEFFMPGATPDAPLQARRGLNILLTYQFKVEKVDGRDRVVLEQVGEPKLSPRPGDGTHFSALSNPTQTVVRRRLKALEPRIVLKPWEPEGEWKGKGVLIPSYATAKDGWLTFGCDWVPAE